MRVSKFHAEFGKKVHQYRLQQQMSQEELAELVELHRNHIGRIERGEANPTLETIFRLARALNVSACELLSC